MIQVHKVRMATRLCYAFLVASWTCSEAALTLTKVEISRPPDHCLAEYQACNYLRDEKIDNATLAGGIQIWNEARACAAMSEELGQPCEVNFRFDVRLTNRDYVCGEFFGYFIPDQLPEGWIISDQLKFEPSQPNSVHKNINTIVADGPKQLDWCVPRENVETSDYTYFITKNLAQLPRPRLQAIIFPQMPVRADFFDLVITGYTNFTTDAAGSSCLLSFSGVLAAILLMNL